MSLCPSSETVNELCPGPNWLVAVLLTKTGLALFVHEAGLSRSAVAEAVSRPTQ